MSLRLLVPQSFLSPLAASAEVEVAATPRASRFWLLHREPSRSPEQIKVLNRLLDGDQPERAGFPQGISAAQYQAVAKVSKATATRHLADLLAKGCLIRLPGGGRNTRYQIRPPLRRLPATRNKTTPEKNNSFAKQRN